MSVSNEQDGRACFSIGDTETREWFMRQWLEWPVRIDQRLTTSGSFHYGGVLAYRIENGRDPPMSRALRTHVAVMDRLTQEQTND